MIFNKDQYRHALSDLLLRENNLKYWSRITRPCITLWFSSFSSENGHVSQYGYNILHYRLIFIPQLSVSLLVNYILTVTDLKAAQDHNVIVYFRCSYVQLSFVIAEFTNINVRRFTAQSLRIL